MSDTTDTAIAEKVERFEKLVQMDPEDATSHFTLGTAYAEAGRHEEAAESFLNAIAINADYSKAFQLAGQSLIEAGDTDRAGKVLTRGYEAAARLGDLMPKKAISAMLEQIGQPIPVVQEESASSEAAPAPDGSFVDRKTGQPGTKLPRPPFRGAIGQWIYDNISNETWQTWLGQGTKIINELRLDLSS
ncbi:MAG: Fe(2+)-trafficking protein, partial [Planctomycetota bacterium]